MRSELKSVCRLLSKSDIVEKSEKLEEPVESPIETQFPTSSLLSKSAESCSQYRFVRHPRTKRPFPPLPPRRVYLEIKGKYCSSLFLRC